MFESGSTLAFAILALVAIQRLSELVLDKRNTTALMKRGAIEHGARHYPLFILLHSTWLVSLLIWVTAFETSVNWALMSIFVILQVGRLWVLRTLGGYWTTRIISVPGAPLITSGPYKFVRHPNYWVVVGEIAVLPLALGAWPIAIAYSILNGVLLAHRIRIENAALSERL